MDALSKNIQRYIKKLNTLRVDRSRGIAPHKPVLLLSIIENIENSNISSNKIYVTPELVGSFKQNWNLLVKTNHNLSFALPFYHLKSDKFWTLIPKTGYEKALNLSSAMRSFKNMNEAIDYAEIETDLYELFLDEETRNILKAVILNKYFPESKNNYLRKFGNDYKKYLDSIEEKILKEPSAQYKQEYDTLDEEEVYVRGNIFKRIIPRIYHYTCCITGLNISVLVNVSMVDACHIVPFSISHDDTIKNGISLCPNLHRAFDGGLMSIDNEYKVIVSVLFTENSESHYSIKKYNNKRIMLPNDQCNWPDMENLKWHRENRLLK